MKTILFAVAALCLVMGTAHPANISSGGVDGPEGGLLQLNQADPYWWFCVQPDGSKSPLAAGPAGYEADVVTLDYGWTRQTTERFAFAGTATPAAQADLALQVNVIEYVLDTYLPWSETTDNFLENVATPPGDTNQNADNDFFNRFYAIQQYVKKLHAKLYQDNSAFTDLSVYSPTSDIPVSTAAEIARNNFFNAIKADVNNKDALDFFNSYAPVHEYAMVNTFKSQADPLDYQDTIIIGIVPEPAASLLALGSMLLLGASRRRV